MDNKDPVCLADVERIASKQMTENAWNYYASGSDNEQTMNENSNTFTRYRIRPCLLRGINKVDTTCVIQDQKISMPICVAPTAMQKLAHPDGERGTAAAVETFGSCMAVSTFSTINYEELVATSPNAIYWMQLYVYKDRDFTISLIRRAEKAGFKAIAMTIDTPCVGYRRVQEKNNFVLPKGMDLAVLRDIPGYSKSSNVGKIDYCNIQLKKALSWEDVDWLKTVTKLPIILKGILTREDALEAIKHNVQGIIVSNHGGRQLDGVSSTIEALSDVVQAVGGKMEVYLDGGIRTGTDVFKALVLGAKAVFIGRPALYGLAYNGEAGVKKVLQLLKNEFERTMLLAGCRSLTDITPNMVVHESYYSRLPNHKL
ncbi:uncharacterized protein LOC130656630 [Hydractinia symbiolongicarpus]|uniref:uncharacterized protein LOC130656630 n=1 Tax=Hydractinia symbiolongicarpus TaxID=13093 RepID=UPI00254BCE89|nr:uncharacterized protein LOC130656630 [Hydractinia symbiolongicarpus]XP_057315506.1 uncharacterized protein LOC130656630 [Hydractinia symbiolongicarpus]